jgi:taurine--2-oxoglutarate transaminase
MVRRPSPRADRTLVRADHWDVVPDLLTMAKGLTSSCLPLGAVAMSPQVVDFFADRVYDGGLTYSAHPVSCAAAIAAVNVLRDDDLVGNAARLRMAGLYTMTRWNAF